MVNSYSTLKLKSRFKYLKEHGQKVTACHWLAVNFDKNSEDIVRLGLTVPKYVGPAVLRNKIKRWSKELTRDAVNNKTFKHGIDMNFFFRHKKKDFYKTVNYEEFSKCYEQAIQKLTRFTAK